MHHKNRRFAALALALLCAAAAGLEATSSAVNAGQGENVTPGMWGGEGIMMLVTENGASIEYACASGRIEHALTTEEGGRFMAKGIYKQDRGGPEREDKEEEKKAERGVPALYSGRTDGKTMTLTVRLAETNERIGTFTLAHGKKVRLTRCM